MANMAPLTDSMQWLWFRRWKVGFRISASGVREVGGVNRTFRTQHSAFLYTVALVAVLFGAMCAFGEAGKKAPKVAETTANVYPLHDGFVDANGVMIYYVSLGRGKPLLIVHGGPGASHEYFLPYLLPLARHNRLVFIDERGSGRS